MCTVRTGLEGPGLTVAQKIWYCVASVGGQYIWARLQSFSAFRRWGDSEQVLLFLGFFIFCLSTQLKERMWWRLLDVGTNVVCIFFRGHWHAEHGFWYNELKDFTKLHHSAIFLYFCTPEGMYMVIKEYTYEILSWVHSTERITSKELM